MLVPGVWIIFLIMGIVGTVLTIFMTLVSGIARQAIPHSVFAQLRSFLPPDAHVLDVGTGRGFLAIETAKKFGFAHVTGVDLWAEKAPGQMHQGFLKLQHGYIVHEGAKI